MWATTPMVQGRMGRKNGPRAQGEVGNGVRWTSAEPLERRAQQRVLCVRPRRDLPRIPSVGHLCSAGARLLKSAVAARSASGLG